MLSYSPRNVISTGLGWVTSCSFQKLPFDCNVQPGLGRTRWLGFSYYRQKEAVTNAAEAQPGGGPPGEHRQWVTELGSFLPLNAAHGFPELVPVWGGGKKGGKIPSCGGQLPKQPQQ